MTTKHHQPLVSVFTPSHDPRYLADCYNSLCGQTYRAWEWVILLNNGIRWRAPLGLLQDPRVRVVTDDNVKGVGACKRAAVEACAGEILLELDHDDVLASTAIERVVAAFDAQPQLGLVYSHAAQVLDDLSPDMSIPFDQRHGWEYRDAVVDGRLVRHAVTMAPTPHNVSLIWYAPNHLRAFTREAYDAVGGYDPTLTVLDDQALMARLYLHGPFHLIDECLYLQRVHDRNTQKDQETNAEIQQLTQAMRAENIEALALAWAEREGLLALDLGAAHAPRPGFIPVDQHIGEDVGQAVADAAIARRPPITDALGTLGIRHTFPEPMDLPDSSVGVIRAADFLEHVADKTAMWNELHRLLAPGGILLTHTPSTDGRGAFQDPTHVAFYNSNSFWYYTQAQYAAYVPESTARFQMARVVNGYPSEFHALHDIVYVTAELICLKDPMPRNGGFVDW